MARIEEKIAEIVDPALRKSIGEEVAKLKRHTRFGLVFEEHQPEVVPIYGKRIKRGERVAQKTGNLSEIWRVVSVKDGHALCELEKAVKAVVGTRESFPTQQLVVIRSMGETIYPSLTPVDSVTNGDPAAPHHVLIEADNYHALQLLVFPYEGKVDCIYIDPPYNTGARDWKYNNDYVDGKDAWRHSKWLTFMDKRLRLAKRLLNPESSVLIVSIDENEVNHLSLVLEAMFPDATMQMVTSVINPRGVYKDGCFSRCDEYLLFVMIGGARVAGEADTKFLEGAEVSWRTLRRSDLTSARGSPKGGTRQFYPIYVNDSTKKIERIGLPLTHGVTRQSVPSIAGCTAVFPIRPDGTEMNWGLTPESLSALWKDGYIKLGAHRPNEPQQYVIAYLTSGRVNDISSGKATVVGHSACGAVIAKYLVDKSRMPATSWARQTHNAETFGSNLLRDVLGDKRFPFPKSLYAVADCIRFFTKNNKNALVVDFFGGSGTTAHAVMLLNQEDDGSRRCILITNNEVSADEAEKLRGIGLQPGDPEWEAMGICRSVTWPRSKFSVRGRRDDGTQLPGDYITGKQIGRERPRAIRHLSFAEGRNLPIAQRKSIAALIPGVTQNKVDDEPWFVDEEIAVSILWDVRQAEGYIEVLSEAEHVTEIYVVTTESRAFTSIKSQIVTTLGPQVVNEDQKRPFAEGFATNVDYFRLDFLDPQEIQMGRQFSAILPILWMMAGARGPRPDAPDAHAPWLLPEGCPFVVLMQETRFKEFVRHVEIRSDLTHVFIVTNSQDTVYKLRREWPELRVVQLYKDYLENFRINLSEKTAQ